MIKKTDIKAIFFDIDNTLYDSTRQTETARRTAVEAMVEAGLPTTAEKGLKLLNEIVEAYGSNYDNHFGVLMKRLRTSQNTHIIAAGIVAYHNTKISMLRPFPDTIPTLLKLRGMNYKLGIITDGIPVKQWEKLIRLGLQHFFHAVIITDEIGIRKPSPKLYSAAADEIGVPVKNCMMVGDRLNTDILGAKKAGMATVRILQGKYSNEKSTKENEPDYIIKTLSDLLKIV